MPDECSPRVTIVIPVKPGGDVAALDAVRTIDYPARLLEVIIAYGNRPSRQRNRAVEQASGDLVYFLDDDSLPVPDAVTRIAAAMRDPAVAGVGGPSCTPPTDSPFQRAIAASLASRLGGGEVRHRYRSAGEIRPCRDNELILCNLAIRRPLFLQCGGLDERLYPNEENELLERIRLMGYTLMHDPNLIVWRSQRRTLPAFVRQMITYGRGRGEQTRMTGRIAPLLLAPPLFVCYLVLLPVIAAPVTLVPLCLYLILLVATVMGITVRDGWGVAARAIAIIPLIHLLYGLGIVAGIAAPRYRTSLPENSVETVVVKRMGDEWGGDGRLPLA